MTHPLLVAAYQMPVGEAYSVNAIAYIRHKVRECESMGVSILCCPEGALGGLADYVKDPASIAIGASDRELATMLAPLASDTVTTIVGYTEADGSGRLYNSAAVLQRGAVVGRYRKRHPAIRASRYTAGTEAPLFTVAGLTFGILVCRDSLDEELARGMVERGAAALFIPTNNAMPLSRGGPELVSATRELDVGRATELSVAVIRADVVGEVLGLTSYGSSAIIDRNGTVLQAAEPGCPGVLMADIGLAIDGRPAAGAQASVP